MNESIEEARRRRKAIKAAQKRLDELADERRREALTYYHRNRFTVRNVAAMPFRVARELWRIRRRS